MSRDEDLARPSLQTGVWFTGGQPACEMARLAALAEHAGVDSVWVAEGQLGRDAFVCLSTIARATESVMLGTAIVNPYTRHPAQLASSFATLDELSGGRVIGGVGIGMRDQLAPLGYDVSKPLSAARESLEMLRGLLARETVTYEGEKFHVAGARMGFRPARDRIPLYLAAAGPKMCALAGELADGIYLVHGTQDFLSTAIAHSHERREPGRPFDVACQIMFAVDEDPQAAMDRVRPGIGFTLTEPNGEAILRGNGLDPAMVQPIRDALANGGVRAMVDAVDDQIVERLTIAGSRETCLAKLRSVLDVGVTHVTVSLLGEDPASALEVLSQLRSGVAA